MTKTPDCGRCRDGGYLTIRGRRWAEAVVCECHTPCPHCGDTLQIIERRNDGRTYVTPCRCLGLRKRVRLFNDAHLPASYHRKTLDSFEPENTRARSVKQWLAAFQRRGMPSNRGVLICGNPGVGKTHLLTATLRYLILERGIACRYVDSFQLLTELKATYEAGSGASALMEDVTSVPILGIDELGKTRTSGWQLDVLDQIVSRRYDEGLTTFVTSNYGLREAAHPAGKAASDVAQWSHLAQQDDLAGRVGPRIYSRLMEMCKPFLLEGRDRRLPAEPARPRGS